MRYHEEMANAKVVNASVRFLGLKEASLRGYTKLRKVRIRKDDRADVLRRLGGTIEKLAKEGERVYFPLALGEHVDHILLSQAGLNYLSKSKSENVYFYEDLPYAFRFPDSHYILYPKRDSRWMSCEETHFSFAKKLRLCMAYKSQVTVDRLYIPMFIVAYGKRMNPFAGSKETVWKVNDINCLKARLNVY